MGIIPVDPVNLYHRGKLLSIASCFIAILIIAWVSKQIFLPITHPILVASMGASAVIVFMIPNSPLAQPWPLIGGQLVSALVGVACSQSFSDPAFASAFAVGGSVLAMLSLRCLHPPGAATALAPVLSGTAITSLGYEFVYKLIGLNVVVMLIIALVINRWLLRHEYPVMVRLSGTKSRERDNGKPWRKSGISERDLEYALQSMDTFVDITSGDLGKLLDNAQKQCFKRSSGKISCADIMVSDISIVEYGTEVEEAWELMQRENLKALPVIDRSRRVIGIITVNDFLKFSHSNTNESYKEKFLAFIRRTPNISTKKPESVGHIMSAPCAVLPESTHIAELVPWLSSDFHGEVPIVNTENRLVGMVYQANLIAALYPVLMLGQQMNSYSSGV